MIYPVTALLTAGLIILLSLIFFWPKYGLFSRWRFLMHQSQRSYLEDALKHIYECEQGHITCTLNSIAGTLFLNKDRVLKLIDHLKNSGLILIVNQGFELTDKGREYALRIIRLHRIWESYLASETGTPETKWHIEAHVQEHKLDEEQVEKISERLGNPRYDPHGDPIPTPEGELPPDRGVLLTELKSGQVAKIIHLEDDVEHIYREIRENGLVLGMQIDSVKHINASILFHADGHKVKLPLISAAQVRVELLTESEVIGAPMDNLLVLRTGESGRVQVLSREVRGQNRRRLLDLGIVPGSVITRVMESASGNPVCYRIKGALIALRNDQAKRVLIEKI